jgi:hypothetical protein
MMEALGSERLETREEFEKDPTRESFLERLQLAVMICDTRMPF